MSDAELAVHAWMEYFGGRLSARESAERLLILHGSGCDYIFPIPDVPDVGERAGEVLAQMEAMLASEPPPEPQP